MIRSVVVALAFAMIPTAAAAADCGGSPEPERNWSGCKRSNLMLAGADLQKADLRGADLSQSDLRKATLTGANLEDAKLAGTYFADAVADGANLTKVEGYRVNFTGLSAKDASFRGAELQRSSFARAVLSGSSFTKAELGRVNFDGAVLGNNDFTFANIARAGLGKAKLEGPLNFAGAYMFLTHIEDADLSSATGLEQAQIDLACGNSGTKLPAGLKASAKWPCRSD